MADGTGLSLVLSWLLVACQVLAVAGVVSGLVVGGAGGRLLSAAGVLILVGGPYLALARIAVSAGKRRSPLMGYAVGTLAVALLGAWLAR